MFHPDPASQTAPTARFRLRNLENARDELCRLLETAGFLARAKQGIVRNQLQRFNRKRDRAQSIVSLLQGAAGAERPALFARRSSAIRAE